MIFYSMTKYLMIMNLLIHSAGQKSAIHRKNVAGNEASAFRSKKDGSAHQFVELAKASHGCTREKFPATLRAIQQLSIEFGAKNSRSDGIHAYTMAGPFNGQRLGQRRDRSFAGSICGHLVEGDKR